MIIPPEAPKSNVEKWGKHKRFAMRVARHMKAAARSEADPLAGRAARMANCAEKIIYNIDPETGEIHYGGTWLCRDRLCPVCAWRLSIKRVGEMIATMQKVAAEKPGCKAIHVCLTVRNCAGEDLRTVIEQISAGFARLRRRLLWTEHILGYMRSIEVTYNENTEEYHPHIHCICIVGPGYLRQISIGEWSEMWGECCRLDYAPIVHATHAYKRPPKVEAPKYAVYDLTADGPVMGSEWAPSDDIKAIKEAIKYPIKPEDLPRIAEAADIRTIAESLAGIRLISFGGIVKRIRAELGYTDHDAPDELPEQNINPGDMLPQFALVYEWAAHLRRYTIKIESRPGKMLAKAT